MLPQQGLPCRPQLADRPLWGPRDILTNVLLDAALVLTTREVLANLSSRNPVAGIEGAGDQLLGDVRVILVTQTGTCGVTGTETVAGQGDSHYDHAGNSLEIPRLKCTAQAGSNITVAWLSTQPLGARERIRLCSPE